MTALAIAELLRRRGENVAVAESSTGGLISAALLEIAGASDYYVGGTVIYTVAASQALLRGEIETPPNMRGATEGFAAYLAESMARRLGTTWAVAETGASGPTGNRYGDAAGHSCIAVYGPVSTSITIETASDDRSANMAAFTVRALDLLAETIASA